MLSDKGKKEKKPINISPCLVYIYVPKLNVLAFFFFQSFPKQENFFLLSLARCIW